VETTTPVAAAGGAVAGTQRTGVLRHLGLGSYWLGTYFVITPLYTVLLQVQVADVGVARDVQGTAIGLATGLGGLFALVLPPVVGAWSDGLRTRFGRRRPIMVAGTLGLVLALLVMLGAGGYPATLTGFVLAVAFVNIAGAAYVAVIPDIVPGSQTGRASGVLGFFVQLGSVTSLLVTLVFARAHQIRLTYVALAVVVVLSLLPTLWAMAGEGRTPAPERARRTLREFLSPLWTGDFGWAFLTRFLTVSALYTTLPFLLIAFRDLLGLANPDQFTLLFELLVTLTAIPFALVCGLLSDGLGRKRFLYAAAGVQAAVLLCFLAGSLIPVSVVLLLGVVYGVGYGTFTAVDWALGLDTLPDRDRPAKDLGLYHVADSLPRVLLPFVMGFVLDTVNRLSPNAGYRFTFVVAAALYVAGGLVATRIRSVR
jgi:MFS family permease